MEVSLRCTYRLSVVTVRVTLQLAITKLVIMTVISNNRFIGLVVFEIECKGTSKVNNLFLCRWKFCQKTVFFSSFAGVFFVLFAGL